MCQEALAKVPSRRGNTDHPYPTKIIVTLSGHVTVVYCKKRSFYAKSIWLLPGAHELFLQQIRDYPECGGSCYLSKPLLSSHRMLYKHHML